MLYLIGLGLSEKDISLKAIDAIKECDRVFVEFYTNRGSKEEIEKLTGKEIEILEREKVESDFLINEAKKSKIALLVSGDCLTATTHIELFSDAKKNEIDVEVIHGTTIFTAVSETGLQLYKFGRVTTLMKEGDYLPESPYDVIIKNRKNGLHSLVLLNVEMDIPEGLDILKELEEKKKENLFKEKIVLCSELGRNSAIDYNKLDELDIDSFKGKIPACIIIPGELNFKEEEVLDLWTKK